MPTVRLTGANRGLGLEFVRQYLARRWRVHACCRNPADAAELTKLAGPNLVIHKLDARDLDAVPALAATISEPIDVLLANAGVYGPNQMVLGQIDYAAWDEVFRVNTMAPLRLAECFAEHVAKSERKTIACVSSLMGSIGANSGGRHYLYRSTKAAANAVVKSLAVDLRDRGVMVVTLHPGWVKTDMGGQDADLETSESVAGVIGVLERLGLADSGKFFNYDGGELPW